MDDVKKCSKCGIISLKSNFHKNKLTKDGLFSQCKSCVIQKQKIYDSENREKILNRIQDNQMKNHDKIIARKRIYSINKYKTDINFRLICKTRSRIRQALNRKSKSSSTIDILGIDINTHKRWIKFQMTPDMTWDNFEIDHVKAICLYDLSKDEELKEAISWKNTQPLLNYDHQKKRTKFIFLDYQLQFIKAYHFIKLNKKGPNEDIHQ